MQVKVDPKAWKVAPDRTEGRAFYYFQGMFECVGQNTNKALPYKQRPEYCFMAVGRLDRNSREIKTIIELFTDRSFNKIYTIEDGWLVLQRENYNFEHNVFQALYDLALLQQNYDKGDANKGKAEPLVGPNSLHKRVMRIEELISKDYHPENSMMEQHQVNSLDKQYAVRLKHSRNLILTGAPGTGKTYLARQIAKAMNPELTEDELKDCVGFVQFHPSYDYVDFVEGLRPIKSEDGKRVIFERHDGTFKKFCINAIEKSKTNGTDGFDNFNDAWDSLIMLFNESENGCLKMKSLKGKDLVVRLMDSGTLRKVEEEYGYDSKWNYYFNKSQCYNVYKENKGVNSGAYDTYRRAILQYMKENCGLKDYQPDDTTNSKPINYVFIIDEINRGDLSKIFGELFFAIDPGYRGEFSKDGTSNRVHTQYEGMLEDTGDVFEKGFYVPDNVYIIGTMNDIDRSVESMDFALRRRFAWQKIRPEDTANEMGITGEVRERMNAMNKAICDIRELGEDYQIGGAYFLKRKDEDLSADDLWRFHLESLIDEYLRGLPEAAKYKAQIENAYHLNSKDSKNGDANEAS